MMRRIPNNSFGVVLALTPDGVEAKSKATTGL